MRLEFSVIGALEFLCYLAIVGFFWREAASLLCARNPDSAIGKAMAFIY